VSMEFFIDEMDEIYKDELRYLILRRVIAQEKHNLDLFNLEVAKFRLEHGMSPQLIYLYVVMGELSRKLGIFEKEAAKLGKHWELITDNIQAKGD